MTSLHITKSPTGISCRYSARSQAVTGYGCDRNPASNSNSRGSFLLSTSADSAARLINLSDLAALSRKISNPRTLKAEDFFLNVVVPFSDEDCLVWPFARDKKGYGRSYLFGKRYYVSRLACEVVHGPAPSDKHVAAHICGRGHEGCVNPRHLRWSTYKQNEHDKFFHGRALIGSKNPNARIDEVTAQSIVNMLASGYSHAQISSKLGVGRRTVENISMGRAWKHIPRPRATGVISSPAPVALFSPWAVKRGAWS